VGVRKVDGDGFAVPGARGVESVSLHGRASFLGDVLPEIGRSPARRWLGFAGYGVAVVVGKALLMDECFPLVKESGFVTDGCPA
jgi:hypothetical protein